MSFWTEVLRPAVKIVAAVVAAYFGYWQIAAVMLQAGIADHQATRAKKAARDAYNAAQRDRQQMVSSATNPRQDVYGRTVVSGTVLFKHSDGPKKEFLYIAVELARHEIDAIESIWIGETEIPSTLWDANGWVTGGPFNKGQVTLVTESRTGPGTIAAPHGVYRIVSAIRMRADGPVDITSLATASGTTITVGGTAHTDVVKVSYEWTEGKPMVRVYTALGSPTQTAFSAWQTEIGTKWTAQHRLRGRAAVGLRLEYDQDVFGQLRDLNIKALVRGKKILDPRTGLTAYSNNAALVTADILRTRMGATAAQLPSAELIAEANICDQLVAIDTVGGTQRRYTCDIAISTSVAPRDSLDLATETMAGSVIWVQGRWLVRAGAWRTPTITLTTADLAEGPRQITPRAQRKGLANAVVATYTEPDLSWVLNPAPEVTSSYYLAQDSGRKLPMQISLEGVTDGVRAQRLAKIELERVRNGGTFSARFSANAYDCMPGEVIYLQMDRYFGATPKAYMVLDRKLDLQSLEIDLTLRETAAAIYDWNGGMPTLVDLTPNTDLPNPLAVPASLTGVSVTSGNSTLLQLSDGTILARARVSWTQHTSAFVTQGGYIDIEWTRVGDTTWITTAQVAGDANTALVGPIDDQSAVLIRLRAVNAAGRASSWLTLPHIVAGKSAPPTAPTVLAVTESAGGQRIFALAHTQDIDHAGYLVRYSATLTASFSGMTLTAAEWSGPGKIGQSSLPADGTWLFAAVAVDSSGNYSDPVYATATLTAIGLLAGSPVGGNMVTNSDFSLGLSGWIVSPATGTPINYFGTERGRSPSAPLVPDGIDALVIRQGARLTGSDLTAYAVSYSTDLVPVKTGERWECSIYYAAHSCWVQMVIEWRNTSGVVFASNYTNGGAISGGQYLSGWERLTLIDTAPAGAVSARLVFIKLNTTTGASESFCWLLMPQLKRAGVSQITPSPYSSGPSGFYGDADATKGAPMGTYIAGQLAEQVVTSIQEINADDKWVPVEKAALVVDWAELYGSTSAIVARANSYSIVSERDNFTAAITALGAYLTALAPAWNDTTSTTTIVRATADALWSTAYSTRNTLLDVLNAEAAKRAAWSSVDEKPEQANICWNGAGPSLAGWSAGVTIEDWGATGYWSAIMGLTGARYALTFQQRDSSFGEAFAVRKDEVYAFTADCVHTGSATGGYAASIGLMLYQADGSVLAYYPAATLAAASVHANLSGTVLIPANAARARIWVRVEGTTNFTTAGNGAHYNNIIVRRSSDRISLVQSAAPELVMASGQFTEANGVNAGSSFGTGNIQYQIQTGDQIKVTARISGADCRSLDNYVDLFLDVAWKYDGQSTPGSQTTYIKERFDITPSSTAYDPVRNSIQRISFIAPLSVNSGAQRSRTVVLNAKLSTFGGAASGAVWNVFFRGSAEITIEVIKKWG